jgi:tricorn protease
MTTRTLLRFLGLLAFAPALALAQTTPGYYRMPAIHGDTVVFTAEGDLWRVAATGGIAQRLTTHAGLETDSAISPDGKWIAFSAQYEGPTEAYVMPLAGGLPKRLTYHGEIAAVRGWTPDGKVLYSTRAFATLPVYQLVAVDPATLEKQPLPLGEADEGVFDDAGKTLFFTRYSFQGSHAKRYVGGTAQNLWRYEPGAKEAVPFHPEFKGISRWPMFWQDRVYFASERDGTSNLWSMRPDGSDLRQHTQHDDFGVKNPRQQGGRIVYQNGADIFLYDIAGARSTKLTISLASDFDQLRETWVTKVSDFLNAWDVSPDGDRISLVVRGQVFVAPANNQGRLVEITRGGGVRYRSAGFFPDGKSLLVLSDETGEVEFWKAPANGVGNKEQLTSGGETLRMYGELSPNGEWLVHAERDQELFVYNVKTKESRRVAKSPALDFDFPTVAWSPDSLWLAYEITAESGNTQLFLYSIASGQSTPVTSDRVNSGDPAFSPDGKWLYFLSDRTFTPLAFSPFGARQPEPFLDKPTKIYQLALGLETRSPFQAPNELDAEAKEAEKKAEAEKKPASDPKTPEGTKAAAAKDAKAAEKEKDASAAKTADAKTETAKADAKADAKAEKKEAKPITVVLEGIMDRLWEVPVPAGNYGALTVNDKALFVTDRDAGSVQARLLGIEIKTKDIETTTIVSNIAGYRLTADGKKIALQQRDDFYVIDAAARAAGDLSKARVNLANLRFPFSPRESWRQMFVDGWRLHRDFFYAKNMHGVDWKANLAKHLPLVDRVTDRAELDDLLNYLISEVSALHTDARNAKMREIDPQITVGSLGARWSRDEAAGGYRLDYIYQSEPEFLELRGPLLKPGLGIKAGDVITAINGVPTLSVPDAAALLRNQAGRQVLLALKSGGKGEAFSRIVTPVSAAEGALLRYNDWEYTRRTTVDEQSQGQIGYVHVRAMGRDNFADFVRGYYASEYKAGLILDLRNNRGGNIDAWMVSRLMRPAWMWWSRREGSVYSHLQSPFRGHLVILVDAFTASDGETMANAIRHLDLGKAIGVRTWGGGIWLRALSTLVDRGYVRAAEFGSFIPGEGWVIEGDGFTPDIIVDNNPAATFRGEDAQLAAAIKHLQELIAKDPRHQKPTPPAWPDKTRKTWTVPKS